MKKNLDPNAPYQPAAFAFRDMDKVREIIARYPEGRARSAVMPLLYLAQHQMAQDGLNATLPHGGWIPRAAMDAIASLIGEPSIHVYEVASFYSMFQTEPVGVHLVQVCTTTPCWLKGSEHIVGACSKHLGISTDQTTADGKFSLVEVECLGACVNAPMVQINDSYYEDLTPEDMTTILDSLGRGETPPAGSRAGRIGAMPQEAPTSLMDQADKKGIKTGRKAQKTS